MRDYERNKHNRKLTGRGQNRLCSEILHGQIQAEINKKNNPKIMTKGIRLTVLETYHKYGILKAYELLRQENDKYGKEIYTREIFESWIAEDNAEHNKGMRSNDGNDR